MINIGILEMAEYEKDSFGIWKGFDSHAFKQIHEIKALNPIENPTVYRMRQLESEICNLREEIRELKSRLMDALEEKESAEALAKEAVGENIILKRRIDTINDFDRFGIIDL
jgi:hypothetical protein